ncbi:MAG: hypothetical protein ABSE91_04275 [Patescibacteria group bacterium]
MKKKKGILKKIILVVVILLATWIIWQIVYFIMFRTCGVGPSC